MFKIKVDTARRIGKESKIKVKVQQQIGSLLSEQQCYRRWERAVVVKDTCQQQQTTEVGITSQHSHTINTLLWHSWALMNSCTDTDHWLLPTTNIQTTVTSDLLRVNSVILINTSDKREVNKPLELKMNGYCRDTKEIHDFKYHITHTS